MDLETDSCALESVEENGLIQEGHHPVYDGKFFQHNGSCSEESKELFSSQNVNAHRFPDNGKEEKGLESSPPVNFGSSSTKSPGEGSPPTTKGYGLKKWRRIRRDHVTDTSANMENSRILKRVLPASANPTSKPSQVPSFDLKQDSDGSIGSVNLNLPKTIGVGDGFTTPGSSLDSRFAPRFAYFAGTDSESSEDLSSKSSTAASAPRFRDKHQAKNLGRKSVGSSSGQRVQQVRSLVEDSKKPRGERIKIKKENSHSSMESDSRSSNFVFMQGAFSVANSGKKGGRMMNYDAGNSDESHVNGQSAYRKENVGEEAEDLSQEGSISAPINGNHCSSTDPDPLAESINVLNSVQEALKKEIQKFSEIGKETTSSHYDADEGSGVRSASLFADTEAGEPSSYHQSGAETVVQTDSASLESEILILTNNVKHLESKLEETKVMLEVKESRISVLEAGLKYRKSVEEETELETLFQRKIEAEIEYLTLTRSIESLRVASGDQVNLFEEQKALAGEQVQMLNKLGEAETKAATLRKQAEELEKQCGDIIGTEEMLQTQTKACKVTSFFFTQLILLALVFWLLVSQLMTNPEMVVPT